MRDARSRRMRWAWWTAALLVVPATLAFVAVLGPGRPPAAEVRVAAPAPVPAPTGARPTPVTTTTPVAPDRERLAATLAARPIVFAADSAELDAAGAATAQELGELLAAAPDLPVLVEGHAADTPGGVEAGQRLSERRAEVVAAALTAAGVGAERVRGHGRGAELPLATVELSRRVEISIG
jgi:outer membrane protein OmpA-like peptidoglycan-associated protein